MVSGTALRSMRTGFERLLHQKDPGIEEGSDRFSKLPAELKCEASWFFLLLSHI